MDLQKSLIIYGGRKRSVRTEDSRREGLAVVSRNKKMWFAGYGGGRLPQVYDRNAHALSQQDPLILDRVGEVVHQGEDILSKLALMLRGVLLLGVVHSHGALPQPPLLGLHGNVGGVGGSLDIIVMENFMHGNNLFGAPIRDTFCAWKPPILMP